MKFAGGLLYTRNSNNLQYVAAASDIMIVYANILADAKISSIECGGVSFTHSDIRSFAKSQVSITAWWASSHQL
jgi:hypothetical protein